LVHTVCLRDVVAGKRDGARASVCRSHGVYLSLCVSMRAILTLRECQTCMYA
jgi:hypothetical protein